MISLKNSVITGVVSILLMFSSWGNAATTTLDKFQWSYDTDEYGSEAIINEKLIRHGGIWIKFKRVPRVDANRNSWAYLTHKLPSSSLAGVSAVSLTYHSDVPLLIKLPMEQQSETESKKQPPHEIKLPATKQWVTVEMDITDFIRPTKTPVSEKALDNELLLEQVKTIHFMPSLTDEKGGEGIIQIRAIEFIK